MSNLVPPLLCNTPLQLQPSGGAARGWQWGARGNNPAGDLCPSCALPCLVPGKPEERLCPQQRPGLPGSSPAAQQATRSQKAVDTSSSAACEAGAAPEPDAVPLKRCPLGAIGSHPRWTARGHTSLQKHETAQICRVCWLCRCQTVVRGEPPWATHGCVMPASSTPARPARTPAGLGSVLQRRPDQRASPADAPVHRI